MKPKHKLRKKLAVWLEAIFAVGNIPKMTFADIAKFRLALEKVIRP